jgi:hypothetical protein
MTPTTRFAPNTPVTHVAQDWHGLGVIVHMHGNTTAEVWWSGMTFTRREPVNAIQPAPATPQRRRR